MQNAHTYTMKYTLVKWGVETLDRQKQRDKERDLYREEWNKILWRAVVVSWLGCSLIGGRHSTHTCCPMHVYKKEGNVTYVYIYRNESICARDPS